MGMGLLDELKNPPKKLSACKVRKTAEGLKPEDAKILLDAVLNPAWMIQPLENALAAKGIPISGTVLKKHRSKTCSCFNA